MEVLAEPFTCRRYQDSDKEDIMKLWQEESGWGAITLEQFDRWFINTPFGKCIIVIATNANNEVTGQIIFSPTEMIVDGKVIKSLRGSAPIIRSDYRERNLRTTDHPAFTLIKRGFEIAAEDGYQLVYSFPSYGWLGLLRTFPKVLPNFSESVSFECFAISLEATQTFSLDNNYEVNIVTSFTQEYEQLWNKAVVEIPLKCSIVRTPKLLKYILGGHLVFETRNTADKSLVGYLAINKKTGLIVDLFAGSEKDLKKVFFHSINFLSDEKFKNIYSSLNQLKGMLTPTLVPVLKDINYSKDNYRFAFSSYLLDNTIPKEKIQQSQWYMTSMG